MSEATFTKKVIKNLKAYPGAFPVKITPGPYGTSGVSDILLCFRGFFIAIELKYGKGKPTRLQEKFMRDVGYKGYGWSLVAWTWKEIKNFLEDFRKEMDI